jgi:hypothetical protein
MKNRIVISETFHEELYHHLYPGDGLEAVAICLCGRQTSDDTMKIIVHKVLLIPYSDCIRREGFIKWPTEKIIPFLEEASKKNLAILKMHSHPGGFRQFSSIDDAADVELFSAVYEWVEGDQLHASAVMLPNGEVFARLIMKDRSFENSVDVIIVGDAIKFWTNSEVVVNEAFQIRNRQAFGEGTVKFLSNLRIAVVGCSGTGSPVVEQLVRIGVKHLVLVDPDKVEEKNLNRIVNSTIQHVKNKAYKVEALKETIAAIGLGTMVDSITENIYANRETINKIASSDLIYGCVDSVDGRHLLNQISTFYCIPYFDLGVKLIADGLGGVSQICGTVHYIKPGGSSLLTRQVYNYEDLRAASLFRKNPDEYNNLKSSGYIANINVDRPAVITVNFLTASIAVNEMLARIHQFRKEPNVEFAITRFSLTDGYFQFESDGEVDTYLSKFVGRGDSEPLLNMPEL